MSSRPGCPRRSRRFWRCCSATNWGVASSTPTRPCSAAAVSRCCPASRGRVLLGLRGGFVRRIVGRPCGGGSSRFIFLVEQEIDNRPPTPAAGGVPQSLGQPLGDLLEPALRVDGPLVELVDDLLLVGGHRPARGPLADRRRARRTVHGLECPDADGGRPRGGGSERRPESASAEPVSRSSCPSPSTSRSGGSRRASASRFRRSSWPDG